MFSDLVHLSEAVGAIEIEAVRLHAGSFELRETFRTSRAEVTHRRAVLVEIDCVVEGLEVTGWGQATTLQGWSSEKLSHSEFDLKRVTEAAEHRALRGVGALAMTRPASARFALEGALLDALAQARTLPLRRLLNPDAPNQIAINATVGIAPIDAACERAVALRDAGFQTLKLKVGDDRDVERAVAVRAAVGDEVRLRLDANGAFDVATARERLAAFSAVAPEYVEQPCLRTDELLAVASRSPVPVAADESVVDLEAARRLVADGTVGVLVLKPAIFGAVTDTLRLAELAAEAGVKLVLTSALDPVVGRATVAQIAAAVGLPDVAMGLGMQRLFIRDVGPEEVTRTDRLCLSSGAGIGFRPAIWEAKK